MITVEAEASVDAVEQASWSCGPRHATCLPALLILLLCMAVPWQS